jgi:uncharacterized protein
VKRDLIALSVAVVCFSALVPASAAQEIPKPRPPVIDMHLHALSAHGWPGGPTIICPGDQEKEWLPVDPREKRDTTRLAESCPNPLIAPANDEDLLREILATMDRYNVVLAATSGSLEHVRRYRQADPKRVLPALNVAVAHLGTPGSLRTLVGKGEIAILGELTPTVEGFSPDDQILEPYLAIAEELDVPLAIHMGDGAPHYLNPQNRALLNNPLLLENMLIRHPKLRVYVMHAGWPMLNEMIYLLYLYPQVYVDVAAIDWLLPRKEFHRYLRGLVEAGFGKRIMFGSDASTWPQTLAIGIESIESGDFLTEGQKRDILYNNAARFLRLDEKDRSQKK